MKSVSYFGLRENGEARVFRYASSCDSKQGSPLNPRFDLRRHSPAGFEWGYGGSGPAQLSLAILADYLEDDQEALRLYQSFKFAIIGNLPHEECWVLTETDIEKVLESLRAGVKSGL